MITVTGTEPTQISHKALTGKRRLIDTPNPTTFECEENSWTSKKRMEKEGQKIIRSYYDDGMFLCTWKYEASFLLFLCVVVVFSGRVWRGESFL